jgi:hypothetical protein
MLCYDFLFFASDVRPFEYEWDYYPAWHHVMQYMRWNSKLEALAESYVRTTLGATEGEPTPPWITIHMRRGDFYTSFCQGRPAVECFASIPVIARRVEEVKKEILERKGIEVKHVIMTSDERDEAWWSEVTDAGWFRLDHLKTVEEYGHWYPVLIDAVIQSNGMGFIGTDASTMSVIARKRVETWHGGAVRMIKWTYPGADDH